MLMVWPVGFSTNNKMFLSSVNDITKFFLLTSTLKDHIYKL